MSRPFGALPRRTLCAGLILVCAWLRAEALAAEGAAPARWGVLLSRDDERWLPTDGGRTTVTAAIHELSAEGRWRLSTEARVITLRIVRSSSEPGKAVNRPFDRPQQTTPDIFLDASQNPGTDCSEDHGGLGSHFSVSVTREAVASHRFIVSSEDYGGFAALEASAPGCVSLRSEGGMVREAAHPLALPRDEDGDGIGDAWLYEAILRDSAMSDEDDEPRGDGTAGDGYSAYEEYRGFFTQGTHRRTSPVTKTLFIQNRHQLDTSAFAASGLEYYDIDPDEWRAEDRVVNHSSGRAHLVDQHGILLVAEDPGNGVLCQVQRQGVPEGRESLGPPRDVERIRVSVHHHLDEAGRIDMEDLRTTVAHALGHACGMRHHGEGSLFERTVIREQGLLGRLLAKLPFADEVHPDGEFCGKRLPAKMIFGKKHDQSSGAVECLMGYDRWGRVYEQPDGSLDCCGADMPRKVFCTSPEGTGWNAGDRAAGRAAAGRGDCMGQLRVRDG